MNITVENINDTRKRLTVTVTAEEVTAEGRAVLNEYARSARLPGFRPGKAPADMVSRRYAREIGEELNRKVSGLAYEYALKESKLSVYAVVSAEGGPFVSGQAGTLNYTVDVLADFTLPTYAGIPIQASSAAVTDAEVEAAILEMREQRADYVTVDRAARAGDFVRLDYVGTLGEKPIAELVPERPIFGSQHGTWEEAGAAEAPGVRAIIDGIVGLKAGDKKEVAQVFPAELDVPALAGQTAAYALTVLEVREKRPAELNEEFLKSMGATTVEELRRRVGDEVKSRKEQQVRAASREQVVQALTGAVDFPLPESAIAQESEALLRDHMERQMGQGATEADFEKHKDELYQSARTAAASRVKLTLILLKIAEKEGLKVANEDLHSRIMQESMMTRQRPEQIVKRLQEDRGLLAQMQRAILHAKTLDFVVAKANVSAPVPLPA